jgi:hypothetical protein
MRYFERYVSIDWSGASTEDRRGDLRVVQATEDEPGGVVVAPPARRRGVRSWTRAECRAWLVEALREEMPRCIVAMDFGFGYPMGADRAMFEVSGWRAHVRSIAETYKRSGSARSAAQEINASPRFAGHGPYRFDENRTDRIFYQVHGVSYYRLVETAIPQAISQWYLGSGGTVGFHTITGLFTLDELIGLRQRGVVDFVVWPQEGITPTKDKHVLAESYPAIYPQTQDREESHDEHTRDAWRVLQWLLAEDEAGTLMNHFGIEALPFGRAEGASFQDQVRFEGWILGA